VGNMDCITGNRGRLCMW